MLPILKRINGEENVNSMNPVTGAEDFSFFQKEIPGLYFLIGGLPEGSDPSKAAPHHTPDFFVDDSGMSFGMRSMTILALDYMEKNLVFGSLCVDQSAIVANGGDRIHLPRHSELTAADTYGGSAPMVEKLVDTPLTWASSTDSEDAYLLDINQAIHSAISITDVAKVQSSYDVMNLYTSKLGYALAKKIDGYLSYKLFQSVAFNAGNDDSATAGSAAGNAIIIETIVTTKPIVKLFIKALITVGLVAHKSRKPSNVLLPSLGISFNLTQACKLNSFGII